MKKIIAIIAFCGTFLAAAAQEGTRRPGFTVAFHPFLSISGTTRVDIEKRIGDTDSWLQLNFQAHVLTSHDDYEFWTVYAGDEEGVRRLRGQGFGLAYKTFFHRRFYYSAGAAYNDYRVRYLDNVWHVYEEDGLTFREYLVDQEIRQRFQKINATCVAGYQSTFRYLVFIDAYAGIGYAYSFYDDSKRAYNDGNFAFGYRGISPVIGFRLGLSF
jgi:hypothetical protein